jgi:hypothetical protein
LTFFFFPKIGDSLYDAEGAKIVHKLVEKAKANNVKVMKDFIHNITLLCSVNKSPRLQLNPESVTLLF